MLETHEMPQNTAYFEWHGKCIMGLAERHLKMKTTSTKPVLIAPKTWVACTKDSDGFWDYTEGDKSYASHAACQAAIDAEITPDNWYAIQYAHACGYAD